MPVKKALTLKNHGSTHRKHIISKEIYNKSNLEPGDVAQFNYKGEYAHLVRPIVLVLNPNWKGYLHAITINYIPRDVLNLLHKQIRDTASDVAARLMRLRLPRLKANISDPERFYYTKLKKFIPRYFENAESPYRTYIVKNITSCTRIDYRFINYAEPEKDRSRRKTKRTANK